MDQKGRIYKGRKLWVLDTGVLHFCVRSTPLGERVGERKREQNLRSETDMLYMVNFKSKFETESVLKQSHYCYHNYYFVVVYVVNIFNYPYHKGQVVPKHVAE